MFSNSFWCNESFQPIFRDSFFFAGVIVFYCELLTGQNIGWSFEVSFSEVVLTTDDSVDLVDEWGELSSEFLFD